jgi:hypothetical protein
MNAHRAVTPSYAIDRRQLLKGFAIGGAGLLAGPLRPQVAHAQSGLTPFDLHFSTQEQYRPFDLIGPNFVQHEAPAQSVSTLVRTGVGPRAPFATVILDVAAAPEGGRLAAGLVQDEGNAVLVTYDPVAHRVAIEVRRGGATTEARAVSATLAVPFRFAFSVNENYVVALAGDASGWSPLARERITALTDLRDPGTLARVAYGYGVIDGGSASLDGVRAGYFGQAGVRDPHVVTYADGAPYIRDGKVYLTLTQAGLGFFQAAHWGVWTLDLEDPSKLEQVANLFFRRDGVVLGDHAGHIVFDDDTGEFLLAMSGWGDFDFNGVHVHYTRTREHVLSGVHVLSTRRMPLPTDVSSWDPAIARIRGRWHVAFVESPSQSPSFIFHPAMGVSAPGAPVDRLALAGRDASVDQTEGMILQRIGGAWYLLGSDGDARRYRVYDLQVDLLGYLDAPYGTNIPHPMVFPITERGRTRYMMVTFDGTQFAEPILGYGTHGDFLVMTAPQTRPGAEFPPHG